MNVSRIAHHLKKGVDSPRTKGPSIFSIVDTRPGLAAEGGTDGGDPDPHDQRRGDARAQRGDPDPLLARVWFIFPVYLLARSFGLSVCICNESASKQTDEE